MDKSTLVILSGVSASRSEADTESKDLYKLHTVISKSRRESSCSSHPSRLQGSFDSAGPFASEWAGSAQDDTAKLLIEIPPVPSITLQQVVGVLWSPATGCIVGEITRRQGLP